ncbi:MAG: hypothetical protein ACTSXQ_00105 [Alphaproteobacteria bacterium]
MVKSKNSLSTPLMESLNPDASKENDAIEEANRTKAKYQEMHTSLSKQDIKDIYKDERSLLSFFGDGMYDSDVTALEELSDEIISKSTAEDWKHLAEQGIGVGDMTGEQWEKYFDLPAEKRMSMGNGWFDGLGDFDDFKDDPDKYLSDAQTEWKKQYEEYGGDLDSKPSVLTPEPLMNNWVEDDMYRNDANKEFLSMKAKYAKSNPLSASENTSLMEGSNPDASGENDAVDEANATRNKYLNMNNNDR